MRPSGLNRKRQGFGRLLRVPLALVFVGAGASCAGVPAMTTSGGLVSFGPNSWTGGERVQVPGTQSQFGLQLISVHQVPNAANYYGRIDLSKVDWTRSVLQVQVYFPNISTFDNDIWASRLELLDTFDGSNGYIMWFDQAARSGLVWITTPLTQLGIAGNPNPGHIVEVRLEIYSRQRTTTSMVLTAIRVRTL